MAGPSGAFIYFVMRHDAVDVVYGTMEGYELLGIPLHGPYRPREEVVTMATHEKVDVAIVGAGASGSVYAAVLAKAGKKVVVLEEGPDWQLSDLVSSDIWGRRIKPAGAPFLLEGKNPMGYAYQRAGRRWRSATPLRQLPAAAAQRLQDEERAQPGPRLADRLCRHRALLRQGGSDIGMSGDAKAEEIWRPAGAPIRCRR